jgi:hypothetical protein
MGHGQDGHLDGSRASRQASGMELEFGLPVVLRDVDTLDELARVRAPAPVEPGDVVASPEATCRVEVVLVRPPGAPVVPVLVRPVELTMSTYA